MMNKILVSGLINIETTLRSDGFPIEYCPVRYPFYGVRSTVSGVGYNLAKALTTLGDDVNFVSITGRDSLSGLIREELKKDGISEEFIIDAIDETAQSVIIYDGSGRRQINVDLKNIQEVKFPLPVFEKALEGCSIAALCNINYSRPFLNRVKQRGIPIATDVHAISDFDDDYNSEFMAAADVLFLSDEWLPCSPEESAEIIRDKYGCEIIVIGLGKKGALLSVKSKGFMGRIPSVDTRPVVNTIGAGDSLFSAFIHYYSKTFDPFISLEKASVFASWKIGERGAAEGFLREKELEELWRKVK